MKSFIVFAAVVAVAYANNVGRAGWGSNRPVIDLELVAAAAAAAAGQASAGQSLLETAAGTIDLPAAISSLNGVQAVGVSQGEDIGQVQYANKPSGATSTINAADGYNDAVATDVLYASIEGGLGATAINVGESDASGEGAVAVEESSYNYSGSKKQ